MNNLNIILIIIMLLMIIRRNFGAVNRIAFKCVKEDLTIEKTVLKYYKDSSIEYVKHQTSGNEYELNNYINNILKKEYPNSTITYKLYFSYECHGAG